MKYEYKCSNETISIEVSNEYYDVLIDFDRRERNNNQTEKRRHVSLEAYDPEDKHIDSGDDIENRLIEDEKITSLHKSIDTLLPQQKELIQKIFFENRSIVSVAREEGVGESAIRDRLKRIYIKMKKVL